MSTRCNIVIQDKDANEVTLYHHHDGYPEGVGVELCEMLDGHSFYSAYDVANYLMKHDEPMMKKDDGTYSPNEFELMSGVAGDAEYVYIVIPHSNMLTDQGCEIRAYRAAGGEIVKGSEIDLAAVRIGEQFRTKLAEVSQGVLDRFNSMKAEKQNKVLSMAKKYVAPDKWGEFFLDIVK